MIKPLLIQIQMRERLMARRTSGDIAILVLALTLWLPVAWVYGEAFRGQWQQAQWESQQVERLQRYGDWLSTSAEAFGHAGRESRLPTLWQSSHQGEGLPADIETMEKTLVQGLRGELPDYLQSLALFLQINHRLTAHFFTHKMTHDTSIERAFLDWRDLPVLLVQLRVLQLSSTFDDESSQALYHRLMSVLGRHQLSPILDDASVATLNEMAVGLKNALIKNRPNAWEKPTTKALQETLLKASERHWQRLQEQWHLQRRKGQSGFSKPHIQSVLVLVLTGFWCLYWYGILYFYRKYSEKNLSENLSGMIRDPLNVKLSTGARGHIGQLHEALRDLQQAFLSHIEVQQRQSPALRRLSQALDVTPNALLLVDEEENILYANKALLRLWQEAIGETLPAHWQGKTLADIQGFWRGISQRALSAEGMLIHPSERRIWRVKSVAVHQGQVPGYVLQWQDVTQESLTEKEANKTLEWVTQGALDRRLSSAALNGTPKVMAEAINQLLETSAQAMGDVAQMMTELARGNFHFRIGRTYQGHFQQLCIECNAVAQTLRQVLQGICQVSMALDHVSEEIDQGKWSLLEYRYVQSAGTQDAANMMRETMNTTQQDGQGAQHPRESKGQCSEAINEGEEIMYDIKKASHKVADIVGLINEVAFKSNLLALNAAVEAAHAVEHGRDECDVAEQVRELAISCTDSANQIIRLVEDTVEKIGDGSMLVNDAGNRLEEILHATEHVSSLASEIALATQGQVIGSSEIGAASAHGDETTQSNGATPDPLSLTTESLRQRAQTLGQQLAFFQAKDYWA